MIRVDASDCGVDFLSDASEETLHGTFARGSQPRVEFPMIGPNSKYAALLDKRQMFDGLAKLSTAAVKLHTCLCLNLP